MQEGSAFAFLRPALRRGFAHALPAIGLAIVAWKWLWLLDRRVFFFADDWAWLFTAAFNSYGKIFSILPRQIYNDRPIGATLLKAVYDNAGLDPLAFNSVLLGLHLLNVALVYAVSFRLLRSAPWAAIVSLVFGTFAQASSAVTWAAAIFDLAGHTFLLLSLYLYLRGGFLSRMASAAMLFLAMRTKEMAIVFPGILMLLEVARAERPWDGVRTALRRQVPHVLLGLVFCFSYLLLFAQPLGRRLTTAASDPYYLDISLTSLWNGLDAYLGLLLARSLPPHVCASVFVVATILMLVTRCRIGVFAAVAFVVQLLPVVFLVNHRNSLYLYMPLFYFVLAAVSLARLIWEWAYSWSAVAMDSEERRVRAVQSALLACLFVAVSAHRLRDHSIDELGRHILERRAPLKSQFEYIRAKFPSVGTGMTFYVANAPPYFNVFDFYDGKGYSLKLLYHDPSVGSVLYKSEEELKRLFLQHGDPKAFLQFDGDRLVDATAEVLTGAAGAR